GAIKGLLGIGQRGFGHLDVGELQFGIHREQWGAGLHRLPLPYRQGLDTTGLVGTDEDQIGLDPALISGILRFGAAGQRQDSHKGQRNPMRAHQALPPRSTMSKCARIMARTSSGSKRSNSPLQTTETMPGAASSCGKRTSASVSSSPRSRARRSMPRMIDSAREITSR